MSKTENGIVWSDDAVKIACPHCGEMIGSIQTDVSGRIQRQPRLRGTKHFQRQRYLFHQEAKELQRADNDTPMIEHTITGKCVTCNLSLELCYYTPVSNVPVPKNHTVAKIHYPAHHVQHWREQGLTLRCECGDRIGFIDTVDEATMKKRRFLRPEYKPGHGRKGGPCARVSYHDKMLWKENLEDFIPVENRVLLKGLQEWCDKHDVEIHDFYDPTDHIETPYNPAMPDELARHYLSLRLKYHSAFQEAAYRVGWSRRELTVTGNCFQCGAFHMFKPEYRKDFLGRCVEELEERRKRTSNP